MDKKGLNALLATLLIVSVGISTAILVWTYIDAPLTNSLDELQKVPTIITDHFEISEIEEDNKTKEFSFFIKKKSNDDSIVGISILAKDTKGTQANYKENLLLSIYERKRITLHYDTTPLKNIDYLVVLPILIKNGIEETINNPLEFKKIDNSNQFRQVSGGGGGGGGGAAPVPQNQEIPPEDPQPPIEPPEETPMQVISYTPSADTTNHTEQFKQAVRALKEGEALEIVGQVHIKGEGLILSNLKNITIRGKTKADGFIVDTQLSNPSPNRAKCVDYQPTAISICNCTNCIFENFIIEGNNKNTVLFHIGNSSSSEVRNTIMQNINMTQTIFFATGNSNNKYLRNIIRKTGKDTRGMWIGNANLGEYEHHVLIAGNNVSDTGHSGIGVMAEYAVIINNTIINSGVAGIPVASAPGAIAIHYLIEGNTIINSLHHGIQSDVAVIHRSISPSIDIVVRNNTIEGCLASGIYAVNAKDWLIENNSIKNNGNIQGSAGVIIEAASGILVRNNAIFNDIATGPQAQRAGIYVVARFDPMSKKTECRTTNLDNGPYNTRNIQLSANTIYNHQTDGVRVVNACEGRMNNVSITDNTIRNSGSWAIIVADETPGEITNITISGNILIDNNKSIRNDAAAFS